MPPPLKPLFVAYLWMVIPETAAYPRKTAINWTKLALGSCINSIAQRSYQETCPQIIPLRLFDLERLIEVISGLRDILLVFWGWLSLHRRLIVWLRLLLLEVLLVLRLRLIIRLVIGLSVVVPVRRLLWLRLRMGKALVIVIASSLSTHDDECEGEK